VEEDELTIPFPSIEEIALGFDENFPNTLVKNLGLFWQPLRITLRTGENIYLIIDFNLLLGPKNQFWFKALKEMLSD
ncbi:MAG: hypothetical protein JWO06_2134, partial [Bacteroidota bacterium]|nr:hypothetical protein [Bacteroidota bacterium]